MEPSTQNSNYDDPVVATQAKNLTKAIFQTESNSDFNAEGRSGEHGAGQWMPATWKAQAKDVLGNENAEMTPENQSIVAQGSIRKLIKQGKNAAQISAIWNSGSDEGWENKIGVNKYGAHYDVPKYVKSVTDAYQKIKQGGQVQADPQNPSSVAHKPEEKDGFFTSLAKGIIEPVATMVARPIQAGAELLGASEEDVNKATKNIAGDWIAPVPHNFGDVTKDVGRAAETVALGMPVGTIGKAATMGAVAGAGAGLESTGKLEDAAKQGAIGAGLGAAGGAVSNVLKKIPSWLAGDAFKDLSPEQVQKVLSEKHIGTASNLLKQSEKAVSKYGDEIDSLLRNTEGKGGGNFSIRATTSQFPEFAGKEEKMIAKLKSFVPAGHDVGLEGNGWERATILKYIDKIADGTATLWEKNRVRSVIDGATSGGYAKLARSINPSAGHDLAMTFASALRSEVQKSEPKTIPVFEEFAKEMGINKAIKKIAEKKVGGLIQWRDIIPFIAGNTVLPGIGGLAGVALNRAANSPATEFATAKAVQGLAKGVMPVANRAGLFSTKK